MDIEMRHLRLVETVADVGSLTAAADRLHLTQSALSHQLRDIEDRLGTALFLRRSRRMMTTPAGQRVLDSARVVLEEIARTETVVRELAANRQGLLRVATECYTCYHWLPGILRDFERTSPGVEVRIEVEATARPLPELLGGRLDLALMTSPVRDRRLAATPLFRDEMLVIVPSGHRFSRQRFVRPADLADETLFTYAPREESYVFEKLLVPAGIQPRQVRQVKLTEAMLELVRTGLGVAVLARWTVEPYLRGHGLAGIRLTPRGFYRHWSAVVPRSLAATDYVVEFLRLVAAHAPVSRADVTSRPVLRAVRAVG
jgi:LysR family transcriptional regulator, regulator for metE and metH